MTDGIHGFLLCVFGVPLWLLYILCVMTIIKEVLERWWMK